MKVFSAAQQQAVYTLRKALATNVKEVSFA